MVIGGIAQSMPDRIKSIIFLDAYIPQDGKSAFDLIPGLENTYKQRLLKEKDKEWLVLSYTPLEFGVTNPNDVTWMKNRLCPMPFHTHDESLVMQNVPFKKIPKFFITFTDFGESMFKSIGQEKIDLEGWNYFELRQGHDAMITAPEELSRFLLEIIYKK